MGISSRLRDIRPPLPAPTETEDEGTSGIDTDVATTVTTRTDKSSYEIPEDGSPITIPFSKIAGKKEGNSGGRNRDKSQTSLLIEYFEGAQSGEKSRSKPSVRVKVSQGSKSRSGSGANDAVQITGIGKDRKPSYTRRISLGSSKKVELGIPPTESAGRNSWEGGAPPVEIEVLGHNGSDISTQSRGLVYAPIESNVSSMPADSMLEGSDITETERSRAVDRDDDIAMMKSNNYLREPEQERSRSRSKERIAQKVMEKLNQRGDLPTQSSKSRSARSLGKQYDDGYSRGSEVSNNPKLLGMVEDTIKRIILPEIQAVKQDRGPRSAEGSRRGSLQDDGLQRRVSKSSSSPNISKNPKVYLNREGDDPGTLLSRGDSDRKMRKSSRGSYTEDRPKSKSSNRSLRDAGAASVGAGILTTAALKEHDSQGDVHRRRKRRSKSRGSRSRSTGINEIGDDGYLAKEEVPPLPMASNLNDSEITRESIVSIGTEVPQSKATPDLRTPVREVSRGSLREARASSNSLRTPTRTPLSRGLGMSHENLPIESPKSSGGGMSTKDRRDVYNRHVDADGYGDSPTSQRKISSPVQSVSSLKKNFEEENLVPKDLRPRSAASRSSAGRSNEKRGSQTSLRSGESSPLAKQSRNVARDGYGSREVTESPGTSGGGEDVDDWYERQHQLNDEYRKSIDAESAKRESFAAATNRDSYQTNPYPQDESRWTMFTDDSQGEQFTSPSAAQDVRGLGANPEYIDSPYGAQSAVASLIQPSTISSGSPTKGSYTDRMSAHLREMGNDSPPMYEGSTLSQTMPSQDRWTALRAHARNVSGSPTKSEVDEIDCPQQSPTKSSRRSIDEPLLGKSSLPVANDPIPEIGHFDDAKSDVTTNPSIIQGPLGGDATGQSTWPYTPEPASPVQRDLSSLDSRSLRSERSKGSGMKAAAAAGAAALAAGYGTRKATVEDDMEESRLTPDLGRRGVGASRGLSSTSPMAFRDEGYVTDVPARSAGSLTPEAEQAPFSREDLDEFNRAMDAQDIDEGNRHARHVSGDSHGMASPLYDSAAGRGKDNIQSKDIVALMDHLTVRDAQRNARDTEIITTLVRSATEMRQSFDEMKRFIVDQDKKIMQNADRSADNTAQRVLSGPRPLPSKSSSTAKLTSEDDTQRKRRNVLRRALEGLKGGKSENELARIETMLVEVLQNMAELKQQGGQPGALGSHTSLGLNEYEKLRNVPDSGYDPEGRADTSSTPSQSGYFSPTPRAEKQQFHSGYDGRRNSVNRVSTVLEGDEDEQDYYANRASNPQYENTERMLTPTQEAYGQRGLTPTQTPPQNRSSFNGALENITPRSADKQRKHTSHSSSIFGVPKISRWSKTTSSSVAPDPATVDSPNIGLRNQKALSEASRSGSTLARYQDEEYELNEDDRLRSTQSLAREHDVAEIRSKRSQASKISRTPSPLIPSEASYRSEEEYNNMRAASPVQDDLDVEFDDPKYQAVRNSLLLQHPQPRQGSTPRHQNTLESQAHQFDGDSRTGSDISQKSLSDFDPTMWGSSGTAGLAKHRLSQLEPLSPVSMSSPGGYAGNRSSRDQGPLVPQQKPPVPPKVPYEEPEPEYEQDWEPQFSNSGFSRGGYYSSPYGSGHLLEPIEEVRYSLETDSGHVSPHKR